MTLNRIYKQAAGVSKRKYLRLKDAFNDEFLDITTRLLIDQDALS